MDVTNEDISPGLIDNDTGSVNVSVYYSVILLRPFRNEVLDTVGTVPLQNLLVNNSIITHLIY
jgi:DNA-directed RNA polymerase subunit E'/Rpb7